MPDTILAPDVIDLKVNFAPGARVLLRAQPLHPPLKVVRVRTSFAGETERNGPVWCTDEEGQLFGTQRQRAYEPRELVACPPGYVPAPTADDPWRALFWIQRHWPNLVLLHGAITMAMASRHVHERIRRDERIAAALAEEPGANAMRRAELAMGEIE